MELKFDNKIMDCNLAQAYLKKHNTFKSFGLSDCEIPTAGSWDLFNNNNKIIYTEVDLDNIFNKITVNGYAGSDDDPNTNRNAKLERLAINLIQIKELIAQLEFTLRAIPLKETYAQIDLIVKQLKCHGNTYNYHFLALSNDAPLLSFGCVAGLDGQDNWNLIVATKNTAVIADILTRLCLKVGLKKFFLLITTEQQIDNFKGQHELLNYKKITDQTLGTVGVITEHSDIESAVDIFLESASHSPWILQKIYVKESIYQQFRETISAKADLTKDHVSDTHNVGDVTECPRKSTLDVIRYQQKVFLFDNIGSKFTSSNHNERVVAIEAYRTTKELLTLLERVSPFYLSLWANNIAEANEIAHAVNSSVVWLNNYAEFRGPDEAYSFLYNVFKKTLGVKKLEDAMGLCKLYESWNKLSLKERSDTLCEVIDIYIKSGRKWTNDLINLQHDLRKFNKATIDIGNDYICMVIERPVGIIEVPDITEVFKNPEIMKAILLGSALGFTVQNSLKEIFEKAGVPVMYVNFEKGNDFSVTSKRYVQNKVIWSNFGTTFAN